MIKDYFPNHISKIVLLSFIVLFATQTFGQIKVSGTVSAATDNLPLPGVNIAIKGTTLGTVTDFGGKYSISVPEGNNILVFSV